jgi:hypothetical protein
MEPLPNLSNRNEVTLISPPENPQIFHILTMTIVTDKDVLFLYDISLAIAVFIGSISVFGRGK